MISAIESLTHRMKWEFLDVFKIATGTEFNETTKLANQFRFPFFVTLFGFVTLLGKRHLLDYVV